MKRRILSMVLALCLCFALALTVSAQGAELGNSDYPNNPPADVDTVVEKVDWIADQCRAAGVTGEWEIALWLHDWLIHNADYDYTYTYYTPDGVLLKGTGVCDSYTRAYNLLLAEFGIECKRLESPEMNHAWNLVKIDGEWCHIDCTWDDPGEDGNCYYLYFGLTDRMMAVDHIWDESDYPECTSNINYYPIRMGLAFTTEEEWFAILDESAANKVEDIIPYYVGDDPDFNVRGLFDEWCASNRAKHHIEAVGVGIAGGHVYYSFYYSDDHRYEQIWFGATCTERGYTKYVCGCGEYYIDEDSYFGPWGHDYENGACIRCGEAGEEILPEVNVAASRMILGNELAMQFAFPKENVLGNIEYVVAVTKTYADGKKDKSILVPQSKWKTSGAYYYVSFDGIAAKEMGDTINVQIQTKDGTAVGEVYTDSVRDYAIRQLRNTTEAKTRTLYVDMLNYGAAAQSYFGYDVENLVTEELTETEKGYGTKTVQLKNKLDKGKGYVASQLNLASSIQLRVKFDGIDDSMYALIMFTNHNGREVIEIIEGSEFMYDGTVVVIDQVAAADYNRDVTIWVCNADGNAVAYATESVASYIARMTGGAEIYSAVAKYCAAAYGYLHK